MDIASLAVLKSQVQVRQQVSVALTKNVMDLAKQNGENIVKMANEEAKLGIGKNIDISI